MASALTQSLPPKSAADEGADQSHLLDRNFQGPRDRLLSLVQHLVCGVEDELVALPHRQCGMGLHHGVTLQWGCVGDVDLHRGAGEGAREIAHRAVGCRSILWVWNSRQIEVGAERIFSVRAIVSYVHQIRSRPGLLKSFSDHESNRLAVTRDFRSRKHRVGLAVIACALRRGVSMREDQNYSGRVLRRACVDRFDLALSDRSFDHKAVQRVVALLHLIGVARAAGDLQPAVDTIERLADNALRTDIEGIGADG